MRKCWWSLGQSYGCRAIPQWSWTVPIVRLCLERIINTGCEKVWKYTKSDEVTIKGESTRKRWTYNIRRLQREKYQCIDIMVNGRMVHVVQAGGVWIILCGRTKADGF